MAKPNKHPTLLEAVIECACGHVTHTRSVRGSYKTDICGHCHPYYTGKEKRVDREGRIERFNRKYKKQTA